MIKPPSLTRYLFGTLLLTALPIAGHAADWIDLFNGKDLTGWVQHSGTAKYTVEDGAIIGSTVPNTGNSFLCTKENYGNFVLELDFKCDPLLNSGVQIRSECFDHATTFKKADGTEVKIATDRVHGYQYEIDMDDKRGRWWTGGLYDEARRDWLFPGSLGGDTKAFTKQGSGLSKQGDWNHVRIEAMGTSIKTYLNGELRASLTDTMTPSGLIGLQVHSVGKDEAKAGLKVAFRNLRLQPLGEGATPAAATAATSEMNTLTEQEKTDGWKLLWDGKTSEGWRSAKSDKFPEKGWTMENGVLSVLPSGGKEGGVGGDIVTREKFANFELVADFKIVPGTNSGIKYYVNTDLNKGAGSAIGLEYQILDDERHPDAKLGKDGDRTMASLYDLITASPNKKPNPIGEWNTARIVSRGKHVEHWLNGLKVLEYERGSEDFRARVAASKYAHWGNFGELPDGPILLQDHGDAVSFRNIKLRPLTAE